MLIHVWGSGLGISIFEGEAQSKVVYFGDDQIALPILGGRAREIFVRTDLDARKAQYPCPTAF